MTALADKLKRRIAATGPIGIGDYMTACLMDPDHGYYATRDPFGASGDFTTAPEISQMFGEMIGLCLAKCWLDQGRPAPFALAELGPGRGTLMADVMRAVRVIPGMVEAAEIHLVEASPTLRAVQGETLAGLGAPHWHDTPASLPELPLFVMANEFFDALPIRQFQRDGASWAERQITLDSAGAFALALSPPAPLDLLAPRLDDTRPGDLVEICPTLPAIVATLASRITDHGGAAIILDYGGWQSLGDTLQAVRDHEYCGILETPGEADLTAHVDFAAIAAAARENDVDVTSMTPQGMFLERLGITERARRLAQGLSGSALESHVAAHRRLTHPDEMGSLFKAIAIIPSGTPTPPGLTP